MSRDFGRKLFCLSMPCFAVVFLQGPVRSANIDWIREFGTSTINYGLGISADGFGSVYVTGVTNGDIGGPNSGGYDAFLVKYDSFGTPIWSRQFGPAFGQSVSTYGSDSVYVAGDGAPGGLVTKYDAAGNLLWKRHPIGISDSISCQGISSDALGNVYPTGIATPPAGTNGFDAFVSSYDSSGNAKWMRQFGTSENDEAWASSPDGLGNVFVAGRTNGALGGPSAGGYDGFLAKYDVAGNPLWTRQFGTAEYDEAMGVAADPLGNVYVTGTAGSNPIRNIKSYAYLTKFDPSGNLLWTRQLNSGSGDISQSVSIDGQGNVIIAGTTSGNLGGPTTNFYDAFAAKYDDAGSLLWIKQFAASSDGTIAWDASADGHGNIYISGVASHAFVAKISDVPEPASLTLLAFGPIFLFPRLLRRRFSA